MEIRAFEAARRLKYGALLLFAVFVAGTAGFHLIEGWTILDALFMTIITITTIGYGEVHPLTLSGKVFDIIVILLGVGSAAYVFASFTRFIVEGEMQRYFGRRRLDKTIMRMSGHYIICGHGRIGSLISQELLHSNKQFLVIDTDPSVIQELERTGIPQIQGNASDEDLLLKAGVKRAKGLIATASSDMTNVYIILVAKELNPDIFVLARAETEDSIKNIKRAGADKVVSPYLIGGRHMANILLKPTVVDFIELATGEKTGEFHIQMEGFKIREGSRLVGKTLKDAPIRKDIGLIVVAVRNHAGQMIFNPSADLSISVDDVLVCIGDAEALKSMKVMAIT
ncbi:MAG TPA: potassium channel protein [Desulfomonilia bacterium]|nr:potassium channel protein [Desulfomonilia bacterium]